MSGMKESLPSVGVVGGSSPSPRCRHCNKLRMTYPVTNAVHRFDVDFRARIHRQTQRYHTVAPCRIGDGTGVGAAFRVGGPIPCEMVTSNRIRVAGGGFFHRQGQLIDTVALAFHSLQRVPVNLGTRRSIVNLFSPPFVIWDIVAHLVNLLELIGGVEKQSIINNNLKRCGVVYDRVFDFMMFVDIGGGTIRKCGIKYYRTIIGFRFLESFDVVVRLPFFDRTDGVLDDILARADHPENQRDNTVAVGGSVQGVACGVRTRLGHSDRHIHRTLGIVVVKMPYVGVGVAKTDDVADGVIVVALMNDHRAAEREGVGAELHGGSVGGGLLRTHFHPVGRVPEL